MGKEAESEGILTGETYRCFAGRKHWEPYFYIVETEVNLQKTKVYRDRHSV
jgi:hypothetical protein